MAVDKSLAVALVMGGLSLPLVLGAGFWAYHAYRAYRADQMRRGGLWLRIQTLGGVSTLEQKLSYDCAICQYSLDAQEKVRKLSCGHVFHSHRTEKCEGIEKWLYERTQRRRRMTCPFCREIPRPVMPWDAQPPLSAPATSSSASALGSSEPLPPPPLDEEEQLLA